MIDTGTGIIAGSIISLAGILLLSMLSNRNWFKRENFKIQKSNVMAENRIKLKKLEKDLGVTHTPVKEAPTGSILDTLKNLDLDKIQDLLELLGSKEESEEAGSDPVKQIMDMVSKNPAVVNTILEKLNIGSGNEAGNPVQQFIA